MICPRAARSVLVLQCREPFLAWACAMRPMWADSLRTQRLWQRWTYLIPGFESLPTAEPWLREWCHLIFADSLNHYSQVIAEWPVDRSWATFTAWFELDLVVGVRDVGCHPLKAEIDD
jgi:hypothetical protein